MTGPGSRRRDAREAAYVDYVTAQQGQLRRLAYALCGDWHRADDILQIALTKLYVAWPRVQRVAHPDAYVRQMIVRTNIDEHRRPWRREAVGIDEARHDQPNPEGAGLEERDALFTALQELPEMQRKVVVLRHWLGLSVAETAAELGIAEGTVKGYTSRGVERLRQVLAAEPA